MHGTLRMATSLDRFIARSDDDTDALAHENWAIFVELARRMGALIWVARDTSWCGPTASSSSEV